MLSDRIKTDLGRAKLLLSQPLLARSARQEPRLPRNAQVRAGSQRGHFQRSTLLCLLLALLAVLPSGCVRRRLNVRTNPPGALVYVDNQLIGTTPCGVDFTYYGTREIRLVKPGYESIAINQPIPTPWYEFPPIDFVSENLVPTKIRDNRTVVYDLRPQVILPDHVLIDRGEQLRRDANAAPGLPPGAVVVPAANVAPPANTALPAIIGAPAPISAGPPPAGTFAPQTGTAPAPIGTFPPSVGTTPQPLGTFPPPPTP